MDERLDREVARRRPFRFLGPRSVPTTATIAGSPLDAGGIVYRVDEFIVANATPATVYFSPQQRED
jgi:hypothetical protein